MKIYAILVNYNGFSVTMECIKSLKMSNIPLNIIVVDNCSTDCSYEQLWIQSKEYAFEVIKTDRNGGFAYGNNIGIKRALSNSPEYILLINNDTVVEVDFLDKMLKGFVDRQVGLVTPLILYDGKRDLIWASGGVFDSHRMVGLSPWQGKDIEEKPNSGYVNFASGCSMLIKQEVFEKVGLLPEDYFMYFEDLDFCLMIQNAGYKLWYENDAIMYHKVSISSGGEDSPFSILWLTKSHVRFIKKYKDEYSLSFVNLFYIYVRKVGKILAYLSKGKIKQAKAVVKGLLINEAN